jgi:formylglycine-generating enzyme required for sulfatase activity
VTLFEHYLHGGYIPVEGGQSFEVPPFAIAKYPITNAQFAKFIEAGGYQMKKWWTAEGWDVKEERNWMEPCYWKDNKWNGKLYPVVGVSWYEALAFSQWLSDMSGDKIFLPSEHQWQRAAQALPDGRDSRYAYPWGNDWNETSCNNAVGKDWQKNSTSPVTQFEGKGSSPCKVVDMVGNVWEWCLTNWETEAISIEKANIRVLRGGAWDCDSPEMFRVDCRFRDQPSHQYNTIGFRLVRL